MANLSAIKLPNGTTYSLKDSGALQLTGGQVTGPVSFGDSVTMDEVTTGDLVVNGSASFTNNIQANTINGVEVGTNPKFTDTNTVTTVSTSGSGNAVTSIIASNGALTVTKGTTFLTSHQDISGKADKSATVSTVAYDSTNKKITKTINGTTSDVVTVATLKTALGSMPASDVYSWAKASSKPTYTASEVGALASNTTYVSKITTTAGAHTAISNKSGAVSFNVPTKTSHLTNDSGFLTSHQTITKAMVTTALGTGSGTTKFLREDGSWAKPAYIANTDAKLQVAEVTSATQYYPLVGTGTTAATRQYDTTGFKYKGTTGTTSAVGSAIVELGNSTASGTAGNKQAQLVMYGSNAKKATITLAAPSADIALALPTSGGTLALTSQIPTVSYPVTSVNSKTGAVSLTASDVGALASNTTYVSKITTTAGAHTAISNKSGAVSFNVPTTAAHVGIKFGYTTSGNNRAVQQDSSGNLYVTQKDDNTTYSIMSASELSTGTATTARTMSAANTKAGLLDLFYPVGSYYETSDTNFNPNTAWGGTWVLETEGLVHIGAGSTYSVGDTGGEKTHTLTIDEMPSHTHTFSYAQYNRGTGSSTTSALQYTGSTKTTDARGGGQAHNIMQPYIVVNRWHRTA